MTPEIITLAALAVGFALRHFFPGLKPPPASPAPPAEPAPGPSPVLPDLTGRPVLQLLLRYLLGQPLSAEEEQAVQLLAHRAEKKTD